MIDISHIHPMLVHFPIALLIAGFFSDVLGLFVKKEFFTRAGFYLLILGTLGAIAAVITGHMAGDGIESGSLKQAVEVHEDAGTLTLWLALITSAFRIVLVWLEKYRGILKAAALVLFLATVLSVARTGYYGGELVYKHAAGVEFSLGNN
ncbi:DUF2231 domain-containing protein [Prolixibacter denitrificans]|uniref:Membrane protein n=1 Tax=Prolixibacter denitrificans TaxID=1541063 RepID=A0A2P8CBK7_9BACT|nr:DUF2231 domain-containing protein [Prolixibacter denitrificans]PSK82344.1 putative membrane protein [Prolixibacter denitrificans]GET22911.1 membrane protein [Prolixibacter denitrificans]